MSDPMNEALEQARRKQRAELEREARKAIELRTRLPQIVERAVRKERERIAVELAENTDLSQREIGSAVDYSPAWVSRAVAENGGK